MMRPMGCSARLPRFNLAAQIDLGCSESNACTQRRSRSLISHGSGGVWPQTCRLNAKSSNSHTAARTEARTVTAKPANPASADWQGTPAAEACALTVKIELISPTNQSYRIRLPVLFNLRLNLVFPLDESLSPSGVNHTFLYLYPRDT